MNQKLNVFFLGGFTYPSGMAGTKRVQNFINYFTSTGINVKVMTIGNVSEFKKINPPKGINNGVTFINAGSTFPNNFLFYLFYPFILIKLFYSILIFKEKHHKNIIYVYNSISIENFLIILFSKVIGYKVILDIVEDYELSLENNSYLHSLKLKSTIFFEKNATYFCHCIIVLSLYLKNTMEKKCKKSLPVCLIPISCEVKKISTKKEFNKPVKICYSGSFGNKDGLSTLINAFNLFNEIFSDSVLLFTGYGSNLPEILKKIKNENIKYIGYLNDEDYYEFISEADILCMTRVGTEYANAGFPFKLGEYLATGNPVIATNVSDVSFYLENMKDCIIISPGNETELLNALNYYIENPQEAFEIGLNGRKKADTYFNSDMNAEKLMNLMLEI